MIHCYYSIKKYLIASICKNLLPLDSYLLEAHTCWFGTYWDIGVVMYAFCPFMYGFHRWVRCSEGMIEEVAGAIPYGLYEWEEGPTLKPPDVDVILWSKYFDNFHIFSNSFYQRETQCSIDITTYFARIAFLYCFLECPFYDIY